MSEFDKGWRAAADQCFGLYGCTWDSECPNGRNCLGCKRLDELINERMEGFKDFIDTAIIQITEHWQQTCGLRPIDTCPSCNAYEAAVNILRDLA